MATESPVTFSVSFVSLEEKERERGELSGRLNGQSRSDYHSRTWVSRREGHSGHRERE